MLEKSCKQCGLERRWVFSTFSTFIKLYNEDNVAFEFIKICFRVFLNAVLSASLRSFILKIETLFIINFLNFIRDQRLQFLKNV